MSEIEFEDHVISFPDGTIEEVLAALEKAKLSDRAALELREHYDRIDLDATSSAFDHALVMLVGWSISSPGGHVERALRICGIRPKPQLRYEFSEGSH